MKKMASLCEVDLDLILGYNKKSQKRGGIMGSKLMTKEEKWELLDAISDAEHAGNEEEAERLLLELPLHPGMAKIAKEMYGKEHLLAGGYNLSEAYAEFGHDWLDK